MTRITGVPRVTILPDRDVRQVAAPDVAAVLRVLGLHADAYLVVRGQEILTRDVQLHDDDQIDLVPVISGGAPCAA